MSSVDAVRACLERIGERDPVVRAWARLDPEAAHAQARAADAEDQARSPLHGVPVGVKDIIDTSDMATEYGSPIYAGHRPDADAACVARLREAGAVILGKTKTTEFAYFHPADTTNPHDPERTPGGSSSGSAAAVADGMVPVALGTQTAGSVIRPASFCGVIGFKPTHGLLDLTGVRPLSERLAGRRVQLIGIGTRWQLVDPDAQDLLEQAARTLGAVEVELPAEADAAVDAQATIMAVGVARSAAAEYERHRDSLSEELLALIEEGLATAPSEYEAAIATGEAAKAALPPLFDGYDALMTPAARGQAPLGLDATGDPVFCRAWTLLGTPAVSVPGPTGADGMPIGVQLVAPRGRDAELLAVARWTQDRLA